MRTDIFYAVKGAKWAAVSRDLFAVVFHLVPGEE